MPRRTRLKTHAQVRVRIKNWLTAQWYAGYEQAECTNRKVESEPVVAIPFELFAAYVLKLDACFEEILIECYRAGWLADLVLETRLVPREEMNVSTVMNYVPPRPFQRQRMLGIYHTIFERPKAKPLKRDTEPYRSLLRLKSKGMTEGEVLAYLKQPENAKLKEACRKELHRNPQTRMIPSRKRKLSDVIQAAFAFAYRENADEKTPRMKSKQANTKLQQSTHDTSPEN